MTIKLKDTWTLHEQIAAGGYGSVHKASNQDGRIVAIKLVPKEPGASRELLIQGPTSPGILPIIDSGEMDEHYVLVMPLAEKSLRKHLSETGPLTFEQALPILLDIVTGLAALDSGIVHRDLKPDNILLNEGQWQIADFGIARYADASTASDTRKRAMTPPYAAPEQWKLERATSATDIYAFAIIAYELINGEFPFPGPDFRDQHLYHPAPELTNGPLPFRSLIQSCLLKPPGARPTAASILDRLRASVHSPSPAVSLLHSAEQSLVEKKASADSIASRQAALAQERVALFKASTESLRPIIERLRAEILNAAPSARLEQDGLLSIHHGEARLNIEHVGLNRPEDSEWSTRRGFDVIASTSIKVEKPRDRFNYAGGQHSLWFCDAQEEGVFRWYELGFTISPSVKKVSSVNPFALDPGDRDAVVALSTTMHTVDTFWYPLPFDQGDSDSFVDRWIMWLAEASSGTLQLWQNDPARWAGKTYRRQK